MWKWIFNRWRFGVCVFEAMSASYFKKGSLWEAGHSEPFMGVYM